MNPLLKVFLLSLVFLFGIYVFHQAKKYRISVFHSVFWLGLCFLFGGVIIFSGILDRIIYSTGLKYPPSIYFFILLMFIFILIFQLHITLSVISKRSKDTAQELSILNKKVKTVLAKKRFKKR
jgi:hypothetical protein